MTFEVQRRRGLLIKQRYRWRMVAGNGEILAHSEYYANEADCIAAVDLVKGNARTAPIKLPPR